MQIIPYPMIAFESNATKAYLEVFYQAGYQFEKIILVVHRKYLSQIHEYVRNNKTQLVEIEKRIFDNLDIKIPFFEECDFKKYTQDIEIIDVFPFYPEELQDCLEEGATYYFSYLGICPESYLKKARFLHIHAGIIPPVRGSDCFFWSLLLCAKPSYSLFFLNNGIDNGDVVYQDFSYEPLPDLSALSANCEQIVYGLLNYYDPYLRARLFVEYLTKKTKKIFTQEQKKVFGYEDRIFFPMHKTIQQYVLQKYFQVGI